jgi:hypothetical protein
LVQKCRQHEQEKERKKREIPKRVDAQPRTLPFLDGIEEPDGYGTAAVLETDEYDDSAVPLDLGEEEIDEFAMLQQLEQERLLIAKQTKWSSRWS